MAKQHFYSRVPARMSMFNRTDSFDTFAFSKGLEREFVEKDLAAVYDNKPSKNDASLIRIGKLNPVYIQYFTKSGVLVQGAISYLPLDYTGERSSYFCHTLIPTEQEENEILSNPDHFVFNKDMFKKDISEFDLTSEKATPIHDYPEINYEPVSSENGDNLLNYDSAMMKRLIFAMLNLACGKGKNIFVSMPYDMDTFSESSLLFVNSLLQIFPYHLRKSFSFATYTDDGTRFGGYSLRFVPEGVPEIPISKGLSLHFGSKIAIGLSDEMVINNNHIVEFFYNLIKNDAIRRDFLAYIQSAVEADPLLKKANLKTLTELVFIFEQCSGLFDEKVILPNDEKLYAFICAFEKHRNALSSEYHEIAFRCLERYPDNHLQIPKEVFQKLTRIYPTESYEAKKVIMNIVLELIHTDLMRDKLFSFVKTNYESEDAQMRSDIAMNLCRVYYGGFLQTQILSFFEEVFQNESEETKNTIFDKLLLTIRTPAVKAKIIEFIDVNYDSLTNEQKNKFYTTFFEMLPECDRLTADLLSLVNKHIASESQDLLNEIGEKIFGFVIADGRKKEPKLLNILVSNSGVCTITTVKTILLEHSDEEIFAQFVLAFQKASNKTKLSIIMDLWQNSFDIPNDIAVKFANAICETVKENPYEFTLFELIDFDRNLTEVTALNEASKAFADTVLDELIRPLLCQKLPDAFSTRTKRDALKTVLQYCVDKPYITFSPSYKPLADYSKLVESAQKLKYAEMIELVGGFTEKEIKLGVVEHLKKDVVNSKEFDEEKFDFSKLLVKVIVAFLSTGEFNFNDIYSENYSHLCEKAMADSENSNQETVENDAAQKSIGYALKIAEMFFVSKNFAEYRSVIVESKGTLFLALNDFSAKQKKAQRWVDEYLTYNKFDEDFAKKIMAIFDNIKPSSGGFFKKIFGK